MAKVDLDVAYIFKCFRHLKLLFQVFHLNFAKVDLDVVYVAMIKYACCKPMLQMFKVFQTYVANVLCRCLKSISWCCKCLFTHVLSVSSVFRCISQMFHLDVLNIDRGVAHATMVPVAGEQRPAAGLRLLPHAFLAQRTSPSPLLSLPSLPFPPSRCCSLTLADEHVESRTSGMCSSTRGRVGRCSRHEHAQEAGQARAGASHTVCQMWLRVWEDGGGLNIFR
jgi:hypothetical protein